MEEATPFIIHMFNEAMFFPLGEETGGTPGQRAPASFLPSFCFN